MIPLSQRIADLERQVAELPQLVRDLETAQQRVHDAMDAETQLILLQFQCDPSLDPPSRRALAIFLLDGTYFENEDLFLQGPHRLDLSELVRVRHIDDGHYVFSFDSHKGKPAAGRLRRNVEIWRDPPASPTVATQGAAPAGEIAEPHERTDGAPDTPIVSTIPTAPSADETPAPPSDDLHEDEATGSTTPTAPSAEEAPAAPGGEQHENDAPEMDETPDFVKETAPLASLGAFSDPTQQGGEMPEAEPEHEPEPADPADDQEEPEEPEEPEQREPTARERLQEYFQDHPDAVATCHTLAAALTMPLSTVKAMLRRLAVDGEIEIVTPGTPKAAATYRARHAEEPDPAVDDTGVDVPSAALEERSAATLTASTVPDVFVPDAEIDTSPERVEPANTTPAPAESSAPVPAPEPDRWGEAFLSDPETEALGCLRRAPNGMSAGLLASRLGWRKSSAQSILGDLITAGFVRQESGTQFKAVR